MKKYIAPWILVVCVLGLTASLWCIMDSSLTNNQQVFACCVFLGFSLLALLVIEIDIK